MFLENWDLGVQIARSPQPEGVWRCPIACWKATFMYFTKIKKDWNKSFFRSTNIFESRKCCGFQTFWIFRKLKKKETQNFSSIVFFLVKCMNVAFQQAIGHLLTPSGRGERAIWTPRSQKRRLPILVREFCYKQE